MIVREKKQKNSQNEKKKPTNKKNKTTAKWKNLNGV